jgi:hypothetical protein
MPERCKQCERYEKGLKELRERRTNLWRRGELTDAASEKLAAEEQQIAEELKKHQATQHGHSPILTVKTLATEPSQSLEEEIRGRAYELYEERGRRTVTTSTTGSAPKLRSRPRTQRLPQSRLNSGM